MTYDFHLAKHLAELYGSSSKWNTYCFEDFNVHIRSLTHRKNKIVIEIANTLKIANAQKVLKNILKIDNQREKTSFAMGRKFPATMLENEDKEFILEYCNQNNIDSEDFTLYSRANFRGDIYTSSKYKKQKKRNNSNIY